MAILLVCGILMIGSFIYLIEQGMIEGRYEKYRMYEKLRKKAHWEDNEDDAKRDAKLAKQWQKAYQDALHNSFFLIPGFSPGASPSRINRSGKMSQSFWITLGSHLYLTRCKSND